MELFICQYCGSERKTANAKSNHEVYCKINPNRKTSKGSPGKRTKLYSVLLENDTEFVLCSYGCGQIAKYKNISGKLMCETSHNKCPENKRKNSSKTKETYLNGLREDQKTQYTNLSEETKIKMAWSKGLTKETDQRIAKMSASLSLNMTGKPGRPHKEETKQKLSRKRIEFLENNSKHCNWFQVGNIKVQGTLERDFAKFLLEKSIIFTRNRISFDNHRIYTPDFYLPEFDLFVEVKGFLYEKDKEKMRRVLSEHNIDLRLAFKSDISKLNSVSDILELQKVTEYIKDIDYSKFENHWVVEGNWYTSLA